MHRHVHFSVHFERDFAKLAQLMAQVDPAKLSAAPYETEDAWAKIAANPTRLQAWIAKRVASIDAIVVLVGTQTYSRPIIRAEIAAAAQRRRPLVGIYVNKIPGKDGSTDAHKGENPFKYVAFGSSGAASNAVCYPWTPGEPLLLEKWIP